MLKDMMLKKQLKFLIPADISYGKVANTRQLLCGAPGSEKTITRMCTTIIKKQVPAPLFHEVLLTK